MATSNALLVLNEILTDRKSVTAPNMEDDDFFEIFAAEHVLRHMRFSCPNVEDGIVGGGDDGGIDSTYLFVNGQFLNGKLTIGDFEIYKKNVVLDWIIIQAKRESSFREDALPKIKQTLSDTFDSSIEAKSLKKTYKSEVIAQSKDLGWPAAPYRQAASRLIFISFMFAKVIRNLYIPR
jgi:hypothetical protein